MKNEMRVVTMKQQVSKALMSQAKREINDLMYYNDPAVIKRSVAAKLCDSGYHKDGSIRSSVYADMYGQLKREYGCVSSYKSIKRKYIADVHDFIDCYTVPRVLEEQINELIKGE